VTTFQRAGRIIAALLVVGAALFVVGAAIERGDHRDEPATAVRTSREQVGHDEAAEAGGAASTAEKAEAGDEEKVLGLDVESPGLLAVGMVLSLALAAFVWRRPRRSAFLVVAVFAAAFTVFDVAEVVHQLDRSKAELAVLAAIVVVVHVSASVFAGLTAKNDHRDVHPLNLTAVA
jgi:hypothetical protein